MALGRAEKEQQLRDLAAIVGGIRLFNKECEKGGDTIDDCESRQGGWSCVGLFNN